MRLCELLNALKADAGREEDLTPDADGIVRLEMDELSLAYKEQDDYPVPGHRALLMWGRFGTLPAENADALLDEMLRANDRADDPSGATVAMIGDDFYLQRTLSADLMDVEAGKQATEDFLRELSEWHGRVANFRPDVSDGSAPLTADGFVNA